MIKLLQLVLCIWACGSLSTEAVAEQLNSGMRLQTPLQLEDANTAISRLVCHDLLKACIAQCDGQHDQDARGKDSCELRCAPQKVTCLDRALPPM